jgi:hypothetical protein
VSVHSAGAAAWNVGSGPLLRSPERHGCLFNRPRIPAAPVPQCPADHLAVGGAGQLGNEDHHLRPLVGGEALGGVGQERVGVGDPALPGAPRRRRPPWPRHPDGHLRHRHLGHRRVARHRGPPPPGGRPGSRPRSSRRRCAPRNARSRPRRRTRGPHRGTTRPGTPPPRPGGSSSPASGPDRSGGPRAGPSRRGEGAPRPPPRPGPRPGGRAGAGQASRGGPGCRGPTRRRSRSRSSESLVDVEARRLPPAAEERRRGAAPRRRGRGAGSTGRTGRGPRVSGSAGRSRAPRRRSWPGAARSAPARPPSPGARCRAPCPPPAPGIEEADAERVGPVEGARMQQHVVGSKPDPVVVHGRAPERHPLARGARPSAARSCRRCRRGGPGLRVRLRVAVARRGGLQARHVLGPEHPRADRPGERREGVALRDPPRPPRGPRRNPRRAARPPPG